MTFVHETLVHETLAHAGKVVRLQPPNHLDLNGAAVLQQQIDATEPQNGDLWWVDMAQVEFIDSAGILVLVQALTLARRASCRLLVCNLRPSIKLVFEITRLDQAFEIADSSINLVELSSQNSRLPLAA
jgi:anti-anti-sigma factor